MIFIKSLFKNHRAVELQNFDYFMKFFGVILENFTVCDEVVIPTCLANSWII